MPRFYRKPVEGHITGGFGADYGTHKHRGVDISCVIGTPVICPAFGEVIQTGWFGTFGNVVLLKHTDLWYTIYAHLSTPSVRVGDYVEVGEVLGMSGNTGLSTGPHLHWQMGKSPDTFGDITQSADPLIYLMTQEELQMEEKRLALLSIAWDEDYRATVRAHDKLVAAGLTAKLPPIKGDGSTADLNNMVMRRNAIAQLAVGKKFLDAAKAVL